MPQSPNTRVSLNGRQSDSPRPLRFVFFGESIVSDWDNPAATTVRAVMRAVVAAGHEALFFEERRNRPTVELLQARGSAPLRAFTERYADLHYRTYELPSGLERTVWFVRQVATADAVVVLDGAPAGVFEEAARLGARHLTRVIWSAQSGDADTAWADLRLTPAGAEAQTGAITCGPAVERQTPDSGGAGSGVLLVAYDDRVIADEARQALADYAPECLSTGAVTGADWSFVPEVALPDRYQRSRVAVVVGVDDNAFATARVLLPVAAGVQTVVVPSPGTTANLAEAIVRVSTVTELSIQIAALLSSDPSSSHVELPRAYDSMVVARQLVEAVRQARLVRLS